MRARLLIPVAVGTLLLLAVAALLVRDDEPPPVVAPPPTPENPSSTSSSSSAGVTPNRTRTTVPPKRDTPKPQRAAEAILADLAAALRREDLEAARALLAELRAHVVPPDVPDERNAALVYQRAFDLISAREDWPPALDRLLAGETLSADEMALLQAWRAENADVFALLRDAARLPESRFPLDYEAGAAMLLPHVAPSIKAAKMLRAEAHLLERSGDPIGGLESAWAGLEMAEALRGDPILISQLVGHVLDGITGTALQGALDPRAAELAAYLDGFDEGSLRAAYRRSLLGDMYSFLPSVMSGQKIEGIDEAFTPADAADYVELIGESLALAQRPYADVRTAYDDFERRAQEASGVARYLLPAVGRSAAQTARAEGRMRMMQAALTLERHRARHGRYPDAFDAPVDPLTGRPFAYERVDGGYRLNNEPDDASLRLEFWSARRD